MSPGEPRCPQVSPGEPSPAAQLHGFRVSLANPWPGHFGRADSVRTNSCVPIKNSLLTHVPGSGLCLSSYCRALLQQQLPVQPSLGQNQWLKLSCPCPKAQGHPEGPAQGFQFSVGSAWWVRDTKWDHFPSSGNGCSKSWSSGPSLMQDQNKNRHGFVWIWLCKNDM